MLFSVPDIFLSVTAIANIGLLWFVYENKKESSTHRLFSLFVIFIAFWAVIILLFRLTSSNTFALLLIKLSYISALLLAVFFNRFAALFSYPSVRNPSFERAINAGVGLLSLYILLPGALTLSVVQHAWGKEVILEPYAFTIFTIVFLYFFVGGLLCLARKLMHASGSEKTQLAVIVTTVGVVGLFGMYFNLLLPSPIFQNFQFIWTGPVFTFAFAVVMLYSIFKYQFFNPRAIIAELLVYALLLFLFVRLLLSDALTEQIINGVLLLTVSAVGFLLIRSVHKEVVQREKIAKLAGDLEVANRGQESLIHFISHEVKGALGKCSGIMSLILDGDYGPAPARMVEAVANGLSHTREAGEMLSTILLSANLKSGAMKFNMRPFSLKMAVQSVVQTISKEAKAKGLDLSISVPDEEGTVIGDQQMITTHVVRNLIDNAIRYTPKGNIDVLLSQGPDSFRLSVKDSGVGLSEDDKKQLFTAGGRGKDSVKVNVSSTGYGLFFAKQLVEAHNGTISATSEGRDRGSTFTVTLPRATM